jgi:hypothetical protein
MVFGHSSGAVLSLEAAAAGAAISRLAVYEPPYLTDTSGGEGVRVQLAENTGGPQRMRPGQCGGDLHSRDRRLL